MPADQAERVVAGARALSPFLGDRMRSARILGKSVFVRELLPQDLKLEIETLGRDEAMEVAAFLAHVVGRSHARQMKSSDRSCWIKELGKHRSKSLDAPSWLWDSIVELISSHEGAYLRHCRRWGISAAA
jgi:uncharacterized protein (DUF2252 family)